MNKLVKYYTRKLTEVNADKTSEMVIFLVDVVEKDPKNVIQSTIKNYAKNHNGTISIFIEEWMDNPRLSLVINGIENLKYKFNTKSGIASYVERWTTGSRKIKLGIFYAKPEIENPQQLLDNTIANFIENESYNIFVSSSYNPWVKIVFTGINNVKMKPYNVGSENAKKRG